MILLTHLNFLLGQIRFQISGDHVIFGFHSYLIRKLRSNGSNGSIQGDEDILHIRSSSYSTPVDCKSYMNGYSLSNYLK